MCRGEVRGLHLPMDLAWGEKPPQPLPANASVHFKVGHWYVIAILFLWNALGKISLQPACCSLKKCRIDDGGGDSNDNLKAKKVLKI